MKVPPEPKQVIYIPIKDLGFGTKVKLQQGLEKIKKKQADAFLVGINVGPAGLRDTKNSLTQADLIGKMLQEKAKKLEVPLITYAEEVGCNHGMHLLMHGDTVLANEVSLLGNIGTRITPSYTKDFIEDWHLSMRYVHHGENKVRFNQFEPIKQDDIAWAQNLFQTRIKFIVDSIIEQRKDKIENEEQLREYLSSGQHFYGPKAAELGLIDRVTTPDAYFQEYFKGELYTIGQPKQSFLQKLGLGSDSKSEVFFDNLTEQMGLDDNQMHDPVTEFQANALCMPHLRDKSFI